MTARPSGPESAAHNITAMRGRIHGIADSIAHGDTVHPDALRLALDALVAAVRRHDAEIVRALGPETMVGQYARDTIAERLEPTSRTCEQHPEVEVRFADGPTIRVSRFEVTADAATGQIVVEGFIATPALHPPSGDAVRIAYLGIPGRGALADIVARVDLFSRLTVPHIRIRTTIQPKENR